MIEYIDRTREYERGDIITYVVVKENDIHKKFEIPNSYEQFHIDNIIRDYNNNDRSIRFSV